MSSTDNNMDSEVLVEKIKNEINKRKDIEFELARALRKQRSLEAEISMLQSLLNARSVPDYVMYKTWHRLDKLATLGPKKTSQRAVQKARRTAGAIKRRILP